MHTSVTPACTLTACLPCRIPTYITLSVNCTPVGAEQPPWSHTCRVLVQGGSLAGAAAAPQASIHCWTPGNSSPCAQPLEGFNQEQQLPSDPGQLLTVWAGAALYDALTANPVGGLAANPILCGVELRRRPQQLVTGSASSLFSALEDPVPTAGGGTSPPPGMPQPDWGVTFRGVPHLVLVDSVLTHLPLSPYGPLLQCAACQHLTIANLTMRRLAGPPAAGPGRPRVYGALHASGLRSVVASQVDCVNVTRAHGWACMLLQYACAQGDENNTTAGVGEGSYLMLRAGAFSGNAVVQAGPGQIVEGLGQLGWGAVVLTTDNSWVVGPAATAAAGQAALAQQPASPAGRRNADAAAAGLTAEGGAQKAAVAASAASAASLSSSSSAAAAAAAVVKTSTAQQELSLRSSCRLSSVELRDVDASGNAGGSGALLAVLDLNVVSKLWRTRSRGALAHSDRAVIVSRSTSSPAAKSQYAHCLAPRTESMQEPAPYGRAAHCLLHDTIDLTPSLMHACTCEPALTGLPETGGLLGVQQRSCLGRRSYTCWQQQQQEQQRRQQRQPS